MAVYVLSYDLNTPGQNYAGLIGALEGAGAVKVQLSLWLVDVAQTAVELREAVRSWIDQNDRVFVAEVTETADWAGWRMMLPSAQWLAARRP